MGLLFFHHARCLLPFLLVFIDEPSKRGKRFNITPPVDLFFPVNLEVIIKPFFFKNFDWIYFGFILGNQNGIYIPI